MHRHATLRKRQRDPTGANAQFERGTAPSKLRDEVNDGVDDRRRSLVRIPLVKASSYVLAKVILGHRCTLSHPTATQGERPFRRAAKRDRALSISLREVRRCWPK